MARKIAAILVVTILVLCSSSIFAKSARKEPVTVVDQESSTTSYDWYMNGRMSVSCYGNSCNGVFSSPKEGTQQIQGAILKLKRSDASIIVVRCISKVNIFSSVMMAVDAMNANDPHAPTVYRNCRQPDSNSIVEAELRDENIKLFWHYDGSEKSDSETYEIVGYLKPSIAVQPDSVTSVPSPATVEFRTNSPVLQNFTFPSEGFSSSFPAKPEITKNNISTASGPLELRYFTAQDSAVKFIVMICDYGAGSIDPDSKLALVKTHFMTGNGYIDREIKITLGQYPGIEIEAEDKAGAFYAVRGYMVGQVLYEVRAIIPGSQSIDEAKSLLDSFQLIPRANY